MLTNFDDDFFKSISDSRFEADSDQNDEPTDQQALPTSQQTFVHSLNEYPFLTKAASGEISLAAIAQQLGYKNRSSALRFLRRGYAKLRKQFFSEQHPD